MTPREMEEYRALRATIRERGTARVWILLTGFVAWAALAVATAALENFPIAVLVPLLILAVAFEIAFALHTGVERIGRYIQIFFEDDHGDAGWEHRAMAYGEKFRAPAGDPLLTVYFWSAAVFNLIPALLPNPLPIEWTVVGAAHLLFVFRVATARRHAARQRAIDLERFRELRATQTTRTRNEAEWDHETTKTRKELN